MLVQLWRKLATDLGQGFPNEETSKSEILDMKCAMRSFENINKDIIEGWLRNNACEVGFQLMT
jgi:hypothetical protein